MTKYWQVSAGADQRRFESLFLDYGILCVGGKQYVEYVADKMEVGDYVLLKRGRSQVVAAGMATSRDGVSKLIDPEGWWTDQDGWRLDALQVVDWHTPPEPIEAEGLAIGTLKQTDQDNLRNLTHTIIEKYDIRESKPFPDPVEKVSDEELIDFLVSLGLRPLNAEELTTALGRIRLLANHYAKRCRWNNVKEHEARTFLIVPLLIALGWSEQQMKVEYHVANRQRADIACFAAPMTKETPDPDCRLIVESKGFQFGLRYAGKQARAYAKKYPECKTIVVSNGFCYRVFHRSDGEFSDKADAYVNLFNPKKAYPIDPSKGGAREVFEALMP